MRRSLGLFVLALTIPACSSSSSSSSSDAGASDDSATNNPIAAPDNCVPKTYKGNNLGIGAFCDSTTSCPDSNTTFLVCTAYHDAPTNEYFCTTPCTADKDCGDGAFCVHNPGGSGCVPAQCGGKSDSDSGASDGAVSSDASGDATSD